MSNTTQETLVVEKVTQYGPRANGKTYSISPRLKETGVKPEDFMVGQTYIAEVWTGPKGGKSINSYTSANAPQPTPSLPTTTVQNTKAPGGESPVKPANYGTDKTDDTKMSKSDWALKDRRIENQTIMKAILGSPVLATQAMQLNSNEDTQRFIETHFSFLRGLLDRNAGN